MPIRRLACLGVGAALLAGCGDDASSSGSGGAGPSSSSSTTSPDASTGTTSPDASSSSTEAAGPGTGSGGSSGSGGAGGSGGALGACGEVPESDPDVGQALPERWVDTALAPATGATVLVAGGDDLQAAIDAAAPGDVLLLEAGATFTGPFTLPDKGSDAWITIRTATPDADFVDEGTRVGPSDAPSLARIVAPNTLPGITAAPGAHHYRIIGVEVTPVDASAIIYGLVLFGDGSAATAPEVPHHLILDRSWVHGTPTGYTKRGVQLDCADCAVIDSYVSDCHAEGQDAQAIAGFDGPGPIKIVNDYLEGSGENVMFGGADPRVPDLVPSDIEIRRNHFHKPLTWKVDDPSYAGIHWSVKNLFELKNASRVLFQCNVLENNWADAQVGFAVLFTPRNQDGAAPWSGVSDVTFQDNVVRRTASGLNIAGEDSNNPSTQTARVVVKNNLLHDVDRARFGGDGRVFQVVTPNRPVDGLLIAHNTAFVEGNAALVMGDTTAVASGFIFRDNVTTHGDYGVFGSGAGEGTGALDTFVPGHVFSNNVLIGFAEASYPAGNFFPAATSDVGFVDFAGGDFALAPSSPYAGVATDGGDIGADVAMLRERTAGVAP